MTMSVMSGTPVAINRFVRPGTYYMLGGTWYFHSLSELDLVVRRLNWHYGIRPTRAMAGNARRRELLAKIRKRTFSCDHDCECICGCEPCPGSCGGYKAIGLQCAFMNCRYPAFTPVKWA